MSRPTLKAKKKKRRVSKAVDTGSLRSSAYEMTLLTVRVALPSACLGNVGAGVKAMLSSYLMQYRDDIEGAILAFSDVALAQPHARVADAVPALLHFNVSAKALLFRPRVGMVLEGVVCRIASDHVGLLVAGVFNASISGASLVDNHVFDSTGDCWVDGGGNTVRAGDRLALRVEKLHKSAGLLQITGGLLHKVQPSASQQPVENTTSVQRTRSAEDDAFAATLFEDGNKTTEGTATTAKATKKKKGKKQQQKSLGRVKDKKQKSKKKDKLQSKAGKAKVSRNENGVGKLKRKRKNDDGDDDDDLDLDV